MNLMASGTDLAVAAPVANATTLVVGYLTSCWLGDAKLHAGLGGAFGVWMWREGREDSQVESRRCDPPHHPQIASWASGWWPLASTFVWNLDSPHVDKCTVLRFLWRACWWTPARPQSVDGYYRDRERKDGHLWPCSLQSVLVSTLPLHPQAQGRRGGGWSWVRTGYV